MKLGISMNASDTKCMAIADEKEMTTETITLLVISSR